MPFSGEDDHQTSIKVAKADWDFDDECFDDLSHDAVEFIEELLVEDPRCVLDILYTQRVRRKTNHIWILNCEQCFHCCWIWWRIYPHKCLGCWRNCDGVHINFSGPTVFKATVSPDSRKIWCHATRPFYSSLSISPLSSQIFSLHLLFPLNFHNLGSSLRQHIRGNLDRTSRTQLRRIKPFRKCLVLIYFPANALRLKSVSNTPG